MPVDPVALLDSMAGRPQSMSTPAGNVTFPSLNELLAYARYKAALDAQAAAKAPGGAGAFAGLQFGKWVSPSALG